MHIGIIGGAGYIGSYLYENLKDNHNVTVYDQNKWFEHVNASRSEDISKEELQQFDAVIYLAGLSGRLQCSNKSAEEIYQQNVVNVLRIAMHLGSKQLFIYASTAAILECYVSNAGGNENDLPNIHLFDAYTNSMWQREQVIQTLTNVRTVGLRFGTVIGISPNQRTDLVHIGMLRSAYLSNQITVHNPECSRAVLHLRDLYRAIEKILASSKVSNQHSIYNLASFNSSVRTIADDIRNYKTVPINNIRVDEDVVGFRINSSKFQAAYDFAFEGTQDKIIRELIADVSYICRDKDATERICRVCKSNKLHTVIDIGRQPLANNYVDTPCEQDVYPLCLVRCLDCYHTQLNFTVKPEIMFRNYQYNSGVSKTLCDYFETLCQKIVRDTGLTGGTVLELACNDGSQLDYFKTVGWNTWGVDPAENIVKMGLAKGHNIICGFWGQREFSEIPTPDVILAQNVVAHVPDPVKFLEHCAQIMNDSTYLYVQTSQCNMYANGEFDTIYHEHLSFFTIASMMKAAELSGLCVTEVTKQPIHGTSYLFQMRKGLQHSVQALAALKEEQDIGLYTSQFYAQYVQNIYKNKQTITSILNTHHNAGIPIVAYGAAAKGMTFINFYDLNGIKYIADDATMKQGKYTPGKNIPIVHPAKLADEDEVAIIVFAWNFIDEIVSKIKQIRCTKVTHIIQPFPEPRTFMI
jgi:nucleoside-diphosphate-sugar epimerase/2-polyprenyl-3-methyl-5-hydroxy-6-metoxy-1,4-benzoquinol methylase